MLTRSRALCRLEWSARPTRAVDNKSLDASGTSGLVIDNLYITQLSPAASTPRYRASLFENHAYVCSSWLDYRARRGKRAWPSIEMCAPRALINVAANDCALHSGRDNKSLDASGGSVFRIMTRAAMLD